MNRKGQLGYVGIIACIILFELLVGYFVFEITKENIKTSVMRSCDCDHVLGCSGYLADNGFFSMVDHCSDQLSPSEQEDIVHKFFSFKLVSIIFVVLNLILIIIVIFVIRGVGG